MINCPKCFDPLNDEECKVLLGQIVATVEGRSFVRQILKHQDKRLSTKIPQMKNNKSDILSDIIRYLTKLRLDQNLTQLTVAKKLNVSEWTVHRWETLGKGPGVEMCEKWANLLGASLRIVLNEIKKLEDE